MATRSLRAVDDTEVTDPARRRIVVVTGAAGGVGRAAAVAFGREGARVALIARGRDGLEGARREVEAAGGEALVIPTDVADADAVFAAADRVEREWGPIDVWVNDAMATVFSPVAELAPEEIRRATEVTYLGSVYGVMAALGKMRARDRGTIVQVGSALAFRAVPLQAAYCGAKYALRGFYDALRAELIHEKSNIRVSMVHLAAFNTPQFDWGRNHMGRRPQPMPPIFQPEIAAKAIVFASHHNRREVWVGFPTVKIILATKLAPARVLDYVMAKQAYKGQMTPELAREHPDNLFEPVAGNFGAHGRFDQRARSRSWQLEANLHRGWLAGAALGVLGIAGAAAAAVCLRRR